MKKFLTMLLALSVVFTYTVGTAFATTTSPQASAEAKVAEQQAEMAKAVNEYAVRVVYNQKSNLVSAPKLETEDTDANLTKAAVDVAIAKVISDYNEKIRIAGITALADNNFTTDDAANVEKAWKTDLADDAKIAGVVFTTYATTLYTKAVTDAKTLAVAAIDAVNPALYSKANAEAIKVAAAAAKLAISNAANTKEGLAAVKKALADFETAVKDLKPVADQEKALADYKVKANQELAVKAADLKTKEKADLEAITTNPESLANVIAEANTKLAVLDANVANVLAFYTNQIDAVVLKDTVDLDAAQTAIEKVKAAGITTLTYAKGNASFYGVVDQLTSKDLLVKYANEYAAQLKNQFDVKTGLATFNAATVDAAVAKLVEEINALSEDFNTYSKIQAWMDKEENIPKASDEATALGKAKTAGIEKFTTGDYVSSKWEDANKEAVEALQKEYTAKVKAATSKTEIDALVKEAKEKIDAYLTIVQSDTVKTNTLAAMKTLGYVDGTSTVGSEANGTLGAYANGVAAKNGGKYDSGQIDAIVKEAAKTLYNAVIAEKKALITDAEIQTVLKANYNKALAVIDGLNSDEQLKAAATQVVETIKALHTVATLENKDQYLAAQKAVEAYMDIPGANIGSISNKALLSAYMTRIIGLEKTAVEAQINALPAVITVADKDAVEAARTAADAFEKAYKEFDSSGKYDYGYSALVTAKLEAAEGKLTDAKLVDAAKKVAALPAIVTLENKDAVKAARAAYDLLNEQEKAQFASGLLAKLEAAEKTIASLQSTAVETLKIKARSTAKKGSITVKWTVKGDTTGIDGYQIWKSTKRSSGFKKAFTTTKTSYKNTKGLKKGTRYYYKVRAYKVVDGKNVYSDWSNKAYRIAK